MEPQYNDHNEPRLSDIPASTRRWIGHEVARVEDPALVTGRTEFIDNASVPGMLHAAILRSPHAHARIRRIDISRALALPGVVAVLTGEDVQRWSNASSGYPEGTGLHCMAIEKAHYFAEPVAAGGVAPARDVRAGEHGHHAGQREGAARVDAHDPRVRVRAAQDRGVQHAGHAGVVDELGAPGDQRGILHAGQFASDPAALAGGNVVEAGFAVVGAGRFHALLAAAAGCGQ